MTETPVRLPDRQAVHTALAARDLEALDSHLLAMVLEGIPVAAIEEMLTEVLAQSPPATRAWFRERRAEVVVAAHRDAWIGGGPTYRIEEIRRRRFRAHCTACRYATVVGSRRQVSAWFENSHQDPILTRLENR